MRYIVRTAFILAAGLAFVGCPDPEPQPVEPAVWSPAFDATDVGVLMSVWGPSSQDVWAVGGQLDAGVAWRKQGGTWRAVEVPEGPLLNWVHGAGARRWIVGNDGRILVNEGGGPFQVVESGVTLDLWGVWAADVDRAWAVGGNVTDRDSEPEPVILEWDGVEWARVTLPPIDREIRSFFKVWGTSADNVFVVGAKGVILRYDGDEWTQTSTGAADDFVSLWGTGPDDIVAVGGRQNGMVARWNGTGWTSRVLQGEPGMNGCYVDGDGVAHIVGLRGVILRMAPGGFAVTRDENPDRTLLHAVWGADDRLFAVGGTIDRSPPYLGVALETGD